MEKFYLEEPYIKRKNEAIAFINEFYEYKSDINGTGGLQRFLDDYEGWLEKLKKDYNRIPDETRVPARTYFFIRKNDNKNENSHSIVKDYKINVNDSIEKYSSEYEKNIEDRTYKLKKL